MPTSFQILSNLSVFSHIMIWRYIFSIPILIT
jgi:hypothetical protein